MDVSTQIVMSDLSQVEDSIEENLEGSSDESETDEAEYPSIIEQPAVGESSLAIEQSSTEEDR